MKKALSTLICVILCFGQPFNVQAQINSSAYLFSFTDINGKPVALSDFENKVILIVNTASQCGFTSQYADLQMLHTEYGNKGLVIIGVPSPDFGNQEFSDTDKIKSFTHDTYGVSFMLMSPEHVKGEQAHPFYKWAYNTYGFMGSPKWNFHKYLINKQGQLVNWYSSQTKPTSNKIKTAIIKELSVSS
jgi:glutathione peroxidase